MQKDGKVKKVVTGVIISVVIVVAGFVPLVDVPYQDTETYYVDEPYDAIETYIDTIPLTYEATSYVRDGVVVERYETIIPGLPPMSGEKEVPIEEAWVDVENTDDVPGVFIVHFSGLSPLWGMTHLLTAELEISPGEVGTGVCPAEHIGDWRYDITPSTKEIEQQRTVTKYRQVEEERPVTRYKKGSIIEYVRSSS